MIWNWNLLSPGNLHYISASVNYVWGIYNGLGVYKCPNPFHSKDDCTAYTDVLLTQLDAGDQEVWGVTGKNVIYKRNVDGSGAWSSPISGPPLKHVPASGNGYIWGVDTSNNVYKCAKPCTGGPGWIQVTGQQLMQIDGGYDFVYGVDSYNDIYTLPVNGIGNWRQTVPNVGTSLKFRHACHCIRTR